MRDCENPHANALALVLLCMDLLQPRLVLFSQSPHDLRMLFGVLLDRVARSGISRLKVKRARANSLICFMKLVLLMKF